jgi:hypothetical protein
MHRRKEYEMRGMQWLLNEDVEVDSSLLQAEKRTKRQHEIKQRAHRIDPDYRQRLHEAGLDAVVSSFVKKGNGNESDE